MLIIGNYGLSFGQSQTQMALWSIMSAPLIMSVDLRTIPSWAKDILLNPNLIAINQDKLGVLGKRFYQNNGLDIWTKPLSADRVVFAMVYQYPYGTPAKVSISLNQLGLIRYSTYHFYEAFTGSLIGTYHYNDIFNCTVNPSGSVFAFWAEPAQTFEGHFVEPLPVMTLRPFTKKLKSPWNDIFAFKYNIPK